MRRVRLCLSLLLVAAFVAPAAPAAGQTAGFSDVDGGVHADNIATIAERGITKGCAEGRFCPDAHVTRGQMARFLVRALDLPPSSRDAFSDDDGLSAEPDINALAAAGVTSGCEPGRYCAGQRVRRDQMATFLANGFDIARSRVDFFADDNGNTHVTAISGLAATGVTAGCNALQSRYCPNRWISRAQMATFLARALKLAPRTPVDPTMEVGDRGPRVEALQRRLASLGYWVGGADGVYGHLTQQAMFAFQKAHGLSRDGVYGPRARWNLEYPSAVRHRSTRSGLVVEIDKRRQLLMLVRNGRVEHVFNTSTGTEQPYTHEGRRLLADTPPGTWRITRQINGWRDGELGHLYRPKYFHPDGIAIHGYHSVPPYPASHGCARVSMDAIDWMWNRVPVGTTVLVY